MTPTSGALSATEFSNALPDDYRNRFGPAEIAVHAHVFSRHTGETAVAGLFPWGEPDVTAVCVVANDRSGLLALIGRALAECGFNVQAAEAYCYASTPRVAVDFFWLTDPQQKIGPADVEAFVELLNEVLAGRRPEGHLAIGEVSGARDTTVRFVEQSDGVLAVLEIETADRSGLLWAIARALHSADVEIMGSQIKTQGGRVLDRFSIAERDGSPIAPERRLAIQVAVLSALEL